MQLEKYTNFEIVERVSILNVLVTEISRFNILAFFYSSVVIIVVIRKVKENILRYLDSHTTPPSSKCAHTKPLGGNG